MRFLLTSTAAPCGRFLFRCAHVRRQPQPCRCARARRCRREDISRRRRSRLCREWQEIATAERDDHCRLVAAARPTRCRRFRRRQRARGDRVDRHGNGSRWRARFQGSCRQPWRIRASGISTAKTPNKGLHLYFRVSPAGRAARQWPRQASRRLRGARAGGFVSVAVRCYRMAVVGFTLSIVRRRHPKAAQPGWIEGILGRRRPPEPPTMSRLEETSRSAWPATQSRRS